MGDECRHRSIRVRGAHPRGLCAPRVSLRVTTRRVARQLRARQHERQSDLPDRQQHRVG